MRTFRLDKQTRIDPYVSEFSEEEWEFLQHMGIVGRHEYQSGQEENMHISEARIDFERMADVMRDYKELRQENRTIEAEIMDFFRWSSKKRNRATYTTGEIAGELEHPKSSVSRALGKLAGRDDITKVQKGVYRLENTLW